MTYTWDIHPVKCLVLEQGLSNIVSSIPWTYIGTDEYGKTYTLKGETQVGAPNPEMFSPFEELTRPIVEGWLTSVLDIPAMQAQIEAMAEAEFLQEQTYAYLTLRY